MGRTCIHKVDQYYVTPGKIKLLGVAEEEEEEVEVEKKKEEGDDREKAICVEEVNGAKQCYVENDVKANF